ncbi:hypothetical protein, partial [Streptococcus agalactiae]|uniref:hypothetical protein n=1 Tax=Streptococcus agalactiae TaxID=1311 RepID=UPI0005A9F00E
SIIKIARRDNHFATGLYLVANFNYDQTCYFMHVGHAGSNPDVSISGVATTKGGGTDDGREVHSFSRVTTLATQVRFLQWL